MTAPRKPGLGNPKSRLARPGYDVGYAKPPEGARFKKGKSGNPKGRPKGAKNLQPALNEERMKDIIIEEAYRNITVLDGTRNVKVPMARAVLRSISVKAVKGDHRSQRLFAQLLGTVEAAKKAHNDAWLEAAIEYKIGAEREIARRKHLGISRVDDIQPHPDQVRIDVRNNTARIVGPITREEKAEWDFWVERRASLVGDLAGWLEDLEVEIDEGQRKVTIDVAERIKANIEKIDRLLGGDG